MKLYLELLGDITNSNDPYEEVSCASSILSMLFRKSVTYINKLIYKQRLRDNWYITTYKTSSYKEIDAVDWREIMRFIRGGYNKAKSRLIKEKISLHQFAKRSNPHLIYMVRLHNHVLLLKDRKIYDVFGADQIYSKFDNYKVLEYCVLRQ